MPQCVALLRSINVGDHTVKLDKLRSVFEEMGCSVARSIGCTALNSVIPHFPGHVWKTTGRTDHGASSTVRKLAAKYPPPA